MLCIPTQERGNEVLITERGNEVLITERGTEVGSDLGPGLSDFSFEYMNRFFHFAGNFDHFLP